MKRSINTVKNSNNHIDKKYEKLLEWFKIRNDKVLVALSGGVDSALVAFAAKNAMGREMVMAVTANYQTLSDEELKTASRVAEEIGVNHQILKYNELENPKFVKNDNLRCFHCRNALGDSLLRLAARENIELIVDGSNTDDLSDYRPGMIALHDKGVKSPLIELGLKKNEIRQIAKIKNLSVYDKPSNSCLASRIPYGTEITLTKLRKIENCELLVKKIFNLRQVRVRDHDIIARIEVEKDEMIKLCDMNKIEKILPFFKENGFKHITIDIEGYKNSGIDSLQKGNLVNLNKNVRK